MDDAPHEPHERLHAVLLSTARPVDAAAIGRALAPLLGVTPHDAARLARDAAGLLLDAVPEARARAAADALAAAGIGARVVPSEAVPAAGAVVEPLGVRGIEGGLEVSLRQPLAGGAAGGPRGERREVRWEEVRLAIACALDAGEAPRREEEKRRAVGAEPGVRVMERDPGALLAGENAGLDAETVRLLSAVAKRKRDERRETSLLVDLVLADGRVVRLRKESLASIDLEDERGHSMARFMALARLACAASAARGAPEAPETASLLWSGLLAPALFRAPDELARYERWLLAARPGA